MAWVLGSSDIECAWLPQKLSWRAGGRDAPFASVYSGFTKRSRGDNSVPPRRLRLIEGHVGNPDNVFSCGSIGWIGRYTDGDGEGPSSAAIGGSEWGQVADVFGDGDGSKPSILEGRAREDQDELLAAVPTGDVFTAQIRQEDFCSFAQGEVSGLVPEAVVELLEVIEVEHQDANLRPVSSSPVELPLQRFLHVSPVEQARQWVTDRLVSKPLSELEVGDSQGQMFGEGCCRLE